ncbi:hypothetical protein ACT3RR_08305 [Ewingella sp. AOP8-B2-18]
MTNDALKDYLDYYIKLKNPGFAVLITGEWGAGKTYQVLKSIPKEIQCHISLFGISSTTEIYAGVFAKMFPGKSLIKKTAGMAKDSSAEVQGVTFGAGAIIGSVLDALIKEEVDNSKIIIFDDLERCNLTNKEILGAINKYVEHHMSRVIVLAHDDKTQEDFGSTKEKIIGHSIKVKPQIDEAANYFFSESPNLNNFIAVKDEIINAFKKSNCQSLRIFKHVIKDCVRLQKCLEIRHLKNFEAMKILFSNFTIMNVEYRSGKMTIDDIKDITEDYQMFIFNKSRIESGEMVLTEDQSRIIKIFLKYNEQELLNNIIDYVTIGNILESGYYPKEIIAQKLDSSIYFMIQKEAPAWLKILNFDYLEDEVVNDAIIELNHQFDRREITEIGEMLHMFYVLNLLTKNKILNESYDTLLIRIKEYIDDLLRDKTLTPSSLVPNIFDEDVYERSHNHSYWSSDEYEEHINEAIEYLKEKRNKALQFNYDNFKKEILDAMRNDIKKFQILFLGKGSDIGKYSQTDILNIIPIEDFIITWFLLPRAAWDKVRMTLNSRYRNAFTPILKNEKDWLYELCITLKFESLTQNGLDRYRIERLIPYVALKHI